MAPDVGERLLEDAEEHDPGIRASGVGRRVDLERHREVSFRGERGRTFAQGLDEAEVVEHDRAQLVGDGTHLLRAVTSRIRETAELIRRRAIVGAPGPSHGPPIRYG